MLIIVIGFHAVSRALPNVQRRLLKTTGNHELSDSKPQCEVLPVDPEQDVAAIASIYRHYVLNTFSTFEEVPPTRSEMLQRILTCLDGGYPFLVARVDGIVVGYASTKLFYGRTAFHPSAEDSIFLDPDFCGGGIGKQLLARLIDDCSQRGIMNLIALIGGGSSNTGSTRLHESCGFKVVGNIRNVGRKIGRLHDMSIMQLILPSGNRTVQHVAD